MRPAMKISLLSISILSLSLPLFAQGADSTAARTAPDTIIVVQQTTAAPASVPEAIPGGNICLFSGEPKPGVVFELKKNVKLGKGTYGSVKDILPGFAELVLSRGGNAVINYVGSQRFNILPWRIIRPVARGRAIHITDNHGMSCAEMGGITIQDAMYSK